MEDAQSLGDIDDPVHQRPCMVLLLVLVAGIFTGRIGFDACPGGYVWVDTFFSGRYRWHRYVGVVRPDGTWRDAAPARPQSDALGYRSIRAFVRTDTLHPQRRWHIGAIQRGSGRMHQVEDRKSG